MFKFVLGVTTGWIASRSLDPSVDSPFKPPTYEEIIILASRAKKCSDSIIKQLEEATKND